MNWLYTKIMAWLLGEAIANSDRIKLGLAGTISGVISAAFVLVIQRCTFCAEYLTPELAMKLAVMVAAAVWSVTLKLIHSLDHRDIAAPNEVVEGEAMPEAPADANGVPGEPAKV